MTDFCIFIDVIDLILAIASWGSAVCWSGGVHLLNQDTWHGVAIVMNMLVNAFFAMSIEFFLMRSLLPGSCYCYSAGSAHGSSQRSGQTNNTSAMTWFKYMFYHIATVQSIWNTFILYHTHCIKYICKQNNQSLSPLLDIAWLYCCIFICWLYSCFGSTCSRFQSTMTMPCEHHWVLTYGPPAIKMKYYADGRAAPTSTCEELTFKKKRGDRAVVYIAKGKWTFSKEEFSSDSLCALQPDTTDPETWVMWMATEQNHHVVSQKPLYTSKSPFSWMERFVAGIHFQNWKMTYSLLQCSLKCLLLQKVLRFSKKKKTLAQQRQMRKMRYLVEMPNAA